MKKAFLILSLLLLNIDANAYDNIKVHQLINDNAVLQSSNFITTLRSLGFTGSTPKEVIELNVVNKKKIKDWFEDGAKQEDVSDCRSKYHFHDPTKPFDSAGLSSSIIDLLCLNWGHRSSLIWAQDQDNQWSWQKARSYYYQALTSADKVAREQNFADTFRALGQVMHLLADASVPEHTRNDIHIFPWLDNATQSFPQIGSWTYETWSKYHVLDLNTTATAKDYAITNTSVVSGLIPIFNFWDTTPLPISGSFVPVGLAEYSNYNFLSRDTIFKDYAYPARPNAFMGVAVAEDGQTDNRIYFKGTTSDNMTINHLASTGYLWSELSQISAANMNDSRFNLDDNCYQDYASILVPKAVGYSAGLLNYFFRGKMDATSTPEGFKVKNLSSEIMTSYTDTASGTTYGTIEVYYDIAPNERRFLASFSLSTLPSRQLAPGEETPVIPFSAPSDNIEPDRYIVVFKGRLGNEQNAVVGNVAKTGLYLLAMPIDHQTREGLGKRYYRVQGNTLAPVTEPSLPFSLIDDGAYWDDLTETWTKKEHPESLGVPLGTGGPQYLAKYRDEANRRVRYVPNGSYEKEAYQDRHVSWIDNATGAVIKDYHSVTFIGSPAHNFGAYQENPGWMEYIGTGLAAVLSMAGHPQDRYFTTYTTLNFNDKFIEAPVFKYYGFDTSTREQAIPKDPQAPLPAIVSVNRPEGANQVELIVPGIYSSELFADNGGRATGLGSSGLDQYRISATATTAPVSTGHLSKCSAEDINCGLFYSAGATSTLNAAFDIPSNYNSKVRVHYNDAGRFYEELYINDSLVETTSITADRIQTHFQILASYKNIALVRKTKYVSSQQVYVPYQMPINLVHAVLAEHQWDFSATYALYIGSVNYDLPGITTIRKRRVGRPETPWPPDPPDTDTLPPVDKIAQTSIEDITGYHLDRIFISETFDQKHILVAFDEYEYNNGEGFVHELRYEPSDFDPTMHVLYYAIPEAKMQNADHEATRTGRKLLLFNANGTLKAQLQDPVGLEFTIGSIGILN